MKRLYYILEVEDITLVMPLRELVEWIKDDVGDLERDCPKTYKVTPCWLSQKEYKALEEASI